MLKQADIYSRDPVTNDSISAASVIHGLPRTEKKKGKIK
jgi:hypothetical protein